MISGEESIFFFPKESCIAESLKFKLFTETGMRVRHFKANITWWNYVSFAPVFEFLG